MSVLSTSLTSMRRSPYQSLVAILMLAITFFVAYVFVLFILGTQHILQYFETRPQVIAFFALDATPQQISAAESSMKTKPYVADISVVSKEKALELYQETNKEDPLLLELVTADILPASIEVSGTDVQALQSIETDLKSLGGIDDVVFQQNIVDALKQWTQSIRTIGLGSVALLSLISLLIIMVMLSMKISSKRNAINIMRILGASRWYIRAPFILEGIIYALMGSLIGWGGAYVGLLYLTPWLKNFLGTIPLFPIPWQPLVILLASGTTVGLVLTAMASSIAVQRVMRK